MTLHSNKKKISATVKDLTKNLDKINGIDLYFLFIDSSL